MKNFSLLLLLITTISFSSCKKDSSPEEKNAKNIVGKWQLTSVTQKSHKNGTLEGEQTHHVEGNNVTTEFRNNGTGVDGDGDEFTYKISGSKIIISYKDEDENTEGEIKKLNSNDLVIYIEEINVQGKDTYKYSWEETFLKK
ncbi:lipocalin family protein [Pedobacter sp. ASV1-7]|uniref:lipocalin family protein n=1 Tax=Pedobacter sp. ASV1-7 TaxID=3145237 RepID=UPI0032E918CB